MYVLLLSTSQLITSANVRDGKPSARTDDSLLNGAVLTLRAWLCIAAKFVVAVTPSVTGRVTEIPGPKPAYTVQLGQVDIDEAIRQAWDQCMSSPLSHVPSRLVHIVLLAAYTNRYTPDFTVVSANTELSSWKASKPTTATLCESCDSDSSM